MREDPRRVRSAVVDELPRAHVLRREVRGDVLRIEERLGLLGHPERDLGPAAVAPLDRLVELGERAVHERLLARSGSRGSRGRSRRGRRGSAPPRATTSTGTSAAPAASRCRAGARAEGHVVREVEGAAAWLVPSFGMHARDPSPQPQSGAKSSAAREPHAIGSPLCLVAYGRSNGAGLILPPANIVSGRCPSTSFTRYFSRLASRPALSLRGLRVGGLHATARVDVPSLRRQRLLAADAHLQDRADRRGP